MDSPVMADMLPIPSFPHNLIFTHQIQLLYMCITVANRSFSTVANDTGNGVFSSKHIYVLALAGPYILI